MSDVNVLIVFYSRNGNTAQLAEAIAEGAREEGASVTLRRARDIVPEEIIASVPGWKENRERMEARYAAPTPEDAANADAILFGTPTRFGNISAELKAYVDSLGGLWARGALNGKAGSVFVSTSSTHGGNESTLLSMYHFMAHLGLVIVPTGYTDPALFAAGTPYGASAVSGPGGNQPPTPEDLNVARHQGRLVTRVARALKQGLHAKG